MKHFMIGSVLAVGLVVGLVFGVVAQSRNEPNEILAGQIQPLLVDMKQQIPVSLTLLVPIDSSVHTVTVPLRLDLGLTLDIADTVTVSVDMASPNPAQVTVREPTPTPIPRPGDRIAIVTSKNGTEYEVTNLSVVYANSSSGYLEFSLTFETGQVTRQVEDRVRLEELSRLIFNQQAMELYLLDGSMVSLSPALYTEKDDDGLIIETGTVVELFLAKDGGEEAMVGFEGSVTTSLGLRSSFEIPLEGIESIEFQ